MRPGAWCCGPQLRFAGAHVARQAPVHPTPACCRSAPKALLGHAPPPSQAGLVPAKPCVGAQRSADGREGGAGPLLGRAAEGARFAAREALAGIATVRGRARGLGASAHVHTTWWRPTVPSLGAVHVLAVLPFTRALCAYTRARTHTQAIRSVRLGLVGACDATRGWLGLPAAYVPLVVPASAVAARLQGPLGVLRAPLSLGVLTDTDYATMMAGRPSEPVRACGGARGRACMRAHVRPAGALASTPTPARSRDGLTAVRQPLGHPWSIEVP